VLTERSLESLAKEEARRQFRTPTLLEVLSRWWSKKYRLPSNHELFQEQTLHDLMAEFFVDQYEKRPIEAHRNENGEIQFTDTGDEMIDKWEEQIARGEIPDLNEAFDAESMKGLAKMRQKAQDRDPYQSMKSVLDRVERQAKSEGLYVGKTPQGMTPEKQKLLEELFEKPTFGVDLDE
jgi:hypothetical protein